MDRPQPARPGRPGQWEYRTEVNELFERRGEALCGLADDTNRPTVSDRATWVFAGLAEDAEIDGWGIHEAMMGARPADDS